MMVNADVFRADVDRLTAEYKERKKKTHQQTQMVNMGMWMQCMWTRLSTKKKKERKRLTWWMLCVGCRCVGVQMCWGADVLVCRHGLDMDNCEEKERERKENYWMDTDGSGCRWWKRVQ